MSKWLFGSIVLIALLGALFVIFRPQARLGAETTPTAPALSQADDSIVAVGRVVPAQHANLSFSATGTISDVLVQLGDQVAAGQLLVRLDATRQRAALAQAQATLVQAQANDQDLHAGATPDDLSAAEAQLRQTQAQLNATSGSVTPADLRAAQAALQQAQAQLKQLQSGANPDDLRTADAALQQAQANQASQRDSLSAAKTNAQLDLDRAAQSLTQAQSQAATAKSNWDYVQQTGVDPVTPKIPIARIPPNSSPTNLATPNDSSIYDAFVQASAALRSAESAVQQAQVAYDAARQAEITATRPPRRR